MGVVEIVTVEGEQAITAGQFDSSVPPHADAVFSDIQARVAQTRVLEVGHQSLQFVRFAVVIHDHSIPVITTLGEAACQCRFE